MKEIFAPPQKVPLRVWAEKIDSLSQRRLLKLAQWGRLGGPIAVMPDVHFSENVCVGSVLVTADIVCPTAVGHDLGCGMSSRAFEFEAASLQRSDLERLVAQISERIPAGRHVHRQPQAAIEALRRPLSTQSLSHDAQWLGARHLGTLGGGNHFIELQRDTTGRLWLTVHSGSRGAGAAVETHHARVAASLSAGARAPLPFFEYGSARAEAFMSDLQWALDFAAENRRRMLDETTALLGQYLGQAMQLCGEFDVPHNLITFETHGGKQVLVHRKGAMPAPAGARGIIPGSMGTASYIVEGLGAENSYASCSHGAGRRLSRSEAHKQISQKNLQRQMAKVVYPQHLARALIEEAPAAYKDIKQVLAEQEDLVRPILRLEPIAVIKGA